MALLLDSLIDVDLLDSSKTSDAMEGQTSVSTPADTKEFSADQIYETQA